jgi:hypothetical protein
MPTARPIETCLVAVPPGGAGTGFAAAVAGYAAVMATEHDSDQPAISGNDDETTVETGAGPDQDAEPSLNAPASGRPDGLADEDGSGDEDGTGDAQGGGMARRPPADS